MNLILVSAPASLPVTLAEVKEHIHVVDTDEDSGITGFIRAATESLDGRDGSLGRCLITQTWKMTLDRFASEIIIPLPPCQSIDAITYVDRDGATQQLDAIGYQVLGLRSAEGARLRPAYGASWPATRDQAGALTITFTAGFGDTPADIPEAILAAIKMRVAYLFLNRGDNPGIPDDADDFARNFRTWVF